MAPSDLGACVQQAKAKGWSGGKLSENSNKCSHMLLKPCSLGIMVWQYPDQSYGE